MAGIPANSRHEITDREDKGTTSNNLAAALLIPAGAALHLWYLIDDCPLDLSGDEAHYWEWSRRLDWSYYSKGPLVAWIIYLGRAFLGPWSQSLVGSEMLAVRVPAIVLSVITGWGIFVLSSRVLRSRRLGLLAVAITFTMPILAAGSMLMTIDAPLMCLWIWALIAVERGARTGELWPWLVAGLLIAIGVLAKYTIVLVYPVLVIALWLHSRERPRDEFRKARVGLGFALAIGLLGWLPILFWNSQHSWVSFRHVLGQAGLAGGARLNPLGPLEYLLGQAAVSNPVWFIVVMLAIAAALRGWKRNSAETPREFALTLVVVATILPWATFCMASFITKVQPNWPVLSLASAPALIVWWLSRALESRKRRGVLASGLVFGLVATVLLHHTEWLTPAFQWWTRSAPPWNLTPVANVDPTARLRGWRDLGRAAGEQYQRLLVENPSAFLMADDYQVASQIAFYAPGNPTVYCCQAALGDRLSQYDLWHNPLRNAEDFKGRPCLYVGRLRPVLTEVETGEAPLAGLQQVAKVEHRVRGALINVWSIYRCDSFQGFATRKQWPVKY